MRACDFFETCLHPFSIFSLNKGLLTAGTTRPKLQLKGRNCRNSVERTFTTDVDCNLGLGTWDQSLIDWGWDLSGQGQQNMPSNWSHSCHHFGNWYMYMLVPVPVMDRQWHLKGLCLRFDGTPCMYPACCTTLIRLTPWTNDIGLKYSFGDSLLSPALLSKTNSHSTCLLLH